MIFDYIVLGLAIFITTWALFVSLIPHKDREMKPMIRYPYKVLFAIGVFLDVIFNIFWATLIFWQLPYVGKRFDLTLSQRLRRILREDTNIRKGSIRYKLAKLICSKLIEPHDKNHCGLDDLK